MSKKSMNRHGSTKVINSGEKADGYKLNWSDYTDILRPSYYKASDGTSIEMKSRKENEKLPRLQSSNGLSSRKLHRKESAEIKLRSKIYDNAIKCNDNLKTLSLADCLQAMCIERPKRSCIIDYSLFGWRLLKKEDNPHDLPTIIRRKSKNVSSLHKYPSKLNSLEHITKRETSKQRNRLNAHHKRDTRNGLHIAEINRNIGANNERHFIINKETGTLASLNKAIIRTNKSAYSEDVSFRQVQSDKEKKVTFLNANEHSEIQTKESTSDTHAQRLFVPPMGNEMEGRPPLDQIKNATGSTQIMKNDLLRLRTNNLTLYPESSFTDPETPAIYVTPSEHAQK